MRVWARAVPPSARAHDRRPILAGFERIELPRDRWSDSPAIIRGRRGPSKSLAAEMPSSIAADISGRSGNKPPILVAEELGRRGNAAEAAGNDRKPGARPDRYLGGQIGEPATGRPRKGPPPIGGSLPG